jgi:hypothetical protein
MHQCTHCQAQILEQAQFCSYCGTPVLQEQDQLPTDTSTDSDMPEDTSGAEQAQGRSSETEQPPTAPLMAEIADSADRKGVPAPQSPATDEETPEDPPQEVTPAASTSVAASTDPAAEPEPTSRESDTRPDADMPQDTLSLSALPTSVAVSTDPAAEPEPTSRESDIRSDTDMPQDTLSLSALPTLAAVSTDPAAEPEPISREDDIRSDTDTPLLSTPVGKRGPAARRWLLSALAVLLVLAVGTGAFALVRLQMPAGTSSPCVGPARTGCAHTVTSSLASVTQLTFSGSVSGPMTVSAQVRCQATTMESLRTLMVTLSGTVGDHFYNFGFVINHYSGPGAYKASLTILLAVPGEATNNGWGNMSTTDSGTITIAHGEQTGSITYALSGFGARVGTQVQVAGDWTCG